MGRSPCCAKEGLNRGAWTSLEDKILKEYIKVHGEGKWRSLPKRAGLKRCGKSCRLRWLNYLRPDIKRGNITVDEEDLIIRLHKLLGNRWSLIAGRLPGRTDNEIKNYWNTNISKRVEGHSRRSSPPSTLSESKKNLLTNKEQVHGPPYSQKDGSYVVRTKASRCTRVFINAEVEQTQQHGIMTLKGTSITAGDDFKRTNSTTGELVVQPVAAIVGAASPTLNVSTEEDNIINPSDDFILDFELMDDKFLSEFLVSTPFDGHLDVGISDDLGLSTDHASSSHESCQNALLSGNNGQHDSELGSMGSDLPEPALDWLQDE